MVASDRQSEFLRYLARNRIPAGDRLPPLRELGRELGLSVGKLREQLEVARTLGLVEVRPKTGTRTLPFNAAPALWLILRHALNSDPAAFEQFGALRSHVEAAFFHEAARLLESEDKRHLERLVSSAWEKLNGEPIQIPHAEHRDLHLTIFSRLDNPFVRGIVEAYWEAYESVGLNVYSDYDYLHEVWTYHERMVMGILDGRLDEAHAALVEHTGLVRNRPRLAVARAAALVGPGARETDDGRRAS
jgi:DNA-binding FadR family transcriptional regulator